ncbi:flagellar biosynthesis/type III secretory pathway M-ring protein FliF/YscJ [Mycoplasmoides fastidiosum]|uniref:Flagellar biosynthesis/type III secretory pathway M-ring protein FliF/YscJ n=1 Tax=Mycoplasmoides fastidiosum TaxID=92758 RepID=A0ABU0LYE4_9BACT|nr:hypothetical protein [Mycoplasmoides fastidiosum]MDQ0513707.1 flagellar biosynthesis/type III secretory pathway M-ring protein FliF/YscJ [Mycoplasmoides fastidiosum]UUD37870.1 hypothetical protein NPA10_00535 [Mycoplasmoides fastidiosum]
MAKKNKKRKIKATVVEAVSTTSNAELITSVSEQKPLESTDKKLATAVPVEKKSVWQKISFMVQDNWENFVIWWSALDLRQKIIRVGITVALIVAIIVVLFLTLGR